MKATRLTHKRLLQILHYDPLTGVFTWAETQGPRALCGDVAGYLHPSGYWFIGIEKRYYAAHRLAWFYVHGRWPTKQVDHRNRRKTDNRIDNLRDVSGALNMHNQHGPRRHNVCGRRGVSFHKGVGRWAANISVDSRTKHLGYFDDPDEASEVYEWARAFLHEGYLA